jgi:U3 small nucleolar RNA-associated protein 14
MRAPLGSDVNTDKAFRDLTRPKVLKNAGAVIRPMQKPKAEHNKRAKRG